LLSDAIVLDHYEKFAYVRSSCNTT